jgi:hypothetical protein
MTPIHKSTPTHGPAEFVFTLRPPFTVTKNPLPHLSTPLDPAPLPFLSPTDRTDSRKNTAHR